MIENVDQLQLLMNEDFGTEVKIVLEPVYPGIELGKYESGAYWTQTIKNIMQIF